MARHGERARKRHGFQLLAAHNGADAAARCDAPAFVADAGDEGALFSRGADACHAGLFPADGIERLVKRVFRLRRVQTPEIARAAELRGFSVAEEIDRLLRSAGDKDRVIAALLDGGREYAAAAGVAPAPGQRALAGDGPAPCEEGARAAERARGKAENVVRAQGIGPGGDVPV